MKKSKTLDNEPSHAVSPNEYRLVNFLACISIIWIPVVLAFFNVGWGSLLIYSPFLALMMGLPAVVLEATVKFRKDGLPRALYQLGLAFCIVWLLQGLFLVNGNGPDDSGSIVSRLFNNFFDHQFLSIISLVVASDLVVVSLVLLFMIRYVTAFTEGGEAVGIARMRVITRIVYEAAAIVPLAIGVAWVVSLFQA